MVDANAVVRGNLQVNQEAQFLRRKYMHQLQRGELNQFHFQGDQLYMHLQSLGSVDELRE